MEEPLRLNDWTNGELIDALYLLQQKNLSQQLLTFGRDDSDRLAWLKAVKAEMHRRNLKET